jgi:hypothetical protein
MMVDDGARARFSLAKTGISSFTAGRRRKNPKNQSRAARASGAQKPSRKTKKTVFGGINW